MRKKKPTSMTYESARRNEGKKKQDSKSGGGNGGNKNAFTLSKLGEREKGAKKKTVSFSELEVESGANRSWVKTMKVSAENSQKKKKRKKGKANSLRHGSRSSQRGEKKRGPL